METTENNNLSHNDNFDVLNGDGLSHNDLFDIVNGKLKTSNFKILSYGFEPFSEKIGYLGEHSILKILIEKRNAEGNEKQTKELSFFSKSFPIYAAQVQFAEETRAYDKETFANALVFKEMKATGIEILEDCVPNCYFAKDNQILIFDNLAVDGFCSTDKYKTFDYNTVLTVLRSLAKLHASSLIYEEMQSKVLKTQYRLGQEYKMEFEESFYNSKEDFITVKGIEASIKGILTEIDLFGCTGKLSSGKDFKEVAEKCCYNIYDLVKTSKNYRNTICHGDLWSANLLLKHNKSNQPIDCKFVDFQVVRYLPPAHDVMSVLHLNTTREFRKKYMYKVIGMYYNSLESLLKLYGYCIKDILPFTEFLQSCEEQKLFAIIQAATYYQLILVQNETLQKFFEDSELSSKALYEDRSLLILPNIDGDPSYKARLEDTIKDLKDYCESL